MALNNSWIEASIIRQDVVFVYGCESDVERHDIGIVWTHSELWLGYKGIDRAGRFLGFCLTRKSSISSLSRGGIVHQELFDVISRNHIPPDPEMTLESLGCILRYLQLTKQPAYYYDQHDTYVHGIVKEYDDNSVELEAFTPEGRFDSFMLLPLDRIQTIEFGGPRHAL